MAELKKCPFCGGEAIIDREDIFCNNCHVSMRIDDRLYNGEAENYAEAREQTIEQWNNRVTEAEIRNKAITEFADWCYVNGVDFSYMTKGTDTQPFVKTVIERFNAEKM